MNDSDENSVLATIRDEVRTKLRLLKEGRFDELEAFLDRVYGVGSDGRHASGCEILWDKGERERALQELVSRLQSGNYVISHVTLAARYTFYLKSLPDSEFLYSGFVSKFEEESSQLLIAYVYNTLRGMPASESQDEVARLML